MTGFGHFGSVLLEEAKGRPWEGDGPQRGVLDVVVDADSFDPWDSPVFDYPVDDDYTDALATARARTGLDESVLTGSATIRGRRVAMLLCEFSFLAGSIGVAAGDRLVTAIHRATAEGLPLLALPASGGTRMQEGAVAFLQMVKITAAITAHKAAHLPYIVYLRHPTTGGVFASWGS
ncbi:MAG: acyl-CoA carboxylase subunit beta, partial [Mycobacterium sp.]|nr:acyl-CoA carboxylase subunit beta [Mycobacterium sp.]